MSEETKTAPITEDPEAVDITPNKDGGVFKKVSSCF